MAAGVSYYAYQSNGLDTETYTDNLDTAKYYVSAYGYYIMRAESYGYKSYTITTKYYNNNTEISPSLTQTITGQYLEIHRSMFGPGGFTQYTGTWFHIPCGLQTSYYSKTFNLQNYSLTGYNTLKWNTDSALTGTDYNMSGSYKTNTSVNNFYLKKTPNTYIASWSTDGDSANPANSTATYGVSLAIPATAPTKTGYAFAGWNDGTTTYTSAFNYNYASAKTFTAQWTVNTYIASWSTDGGSANPANSTATYGVSLAIPATAPTKTGYAFAGWNDGTTTYTSAFNYNYASAKTFTAQWTANTYIASWSTDGDSANPANSTATYGVSLAIPATAPTKTGYAFAGWNDGTTTYTSAFNYNYASAKTFTAQWTANTYIASWSTDGGSANPANSTATYGVSLAIPATAPTKTGYAFAGWNDGTTTYTNAFNYNYASAKTFTAQWTANTYIASWSTDGGSANPANSTATYGVSLAIPATAPTKTGYAFAGWNDGTTTYTNAFNYNYASAKTFTAQWTANKYTASWSTDGGSANPANSTATYGVSLAIPATAPTKTGYAFAGWNDGTTTYTNAFNYNYASDKTFTAQWTANTYIASWSTNGGSANPANSTATYGVSLAIPATAPTKTGYAFAGWNDGTTTYTNAFNYNYASAKTFTAQWTANTYIASWSTDGGSANPANSTATYGVSLAIPATAPTKTGYAFAGWNDGTTTYTNAFNYNYASDKTFTAQWTANTYIASWSTNGGSANPANSTATYGVSLAIPATAPTKTGYAFAGWNDGTTTYTNAFNYNYASAKTFTAQWTANTYIASWSTDGGSANPANSTATYGVSLAIPATAPTKTGYAFAGWNDGTTTYTNAFNYNYASAKTFTAQWTANTYIASWSTNGGSANPANSTATYGVSLAIPATAPTKTGYAFAGWNDGTTTYTNAFNYNYASAKTFTAQWTANTYIASWSTNGGSANPANSTATYGVSLAIPATAPTKTGYAFAGWNDGTTTYTNAFNYNYASAKTFTAQWTANTYTLIYNLDGGTIANNPTTVTYDASYDLKIPVKTNYTFNGWYSDSNKTTSISTSGTTWKLTSVNIYAKYTINGYNLTYDTNNIGGTGKTYNTVIVGTTPDIPIPKAFGYTFNGWYDSQSGGNKIINSDGAGGYTMPAAATTLYAQWTVKSDVRLSYLEATFGNIITGNSRKSISEYQNSISKVASTRTALKADFIGKGPNL